MQIQQLKMSPDTTQAFLITEIKQGDLPRNKLSSTDAMIYLTSDKLPAMPPLAMRFNKGAVLFNGTEYPPGVVRLDGPTAVPGAADFALCVTVLLEGPAPEKYRNADVDKILNHLPIEISE